MEERQIQWIESLLYMIWCALHQKVPEQEQMEKVNIEQLFRLSEWNNITALLWLPLQMYYGEHMPQGEVWREWKEKRDKTICKNILMDSEREALYQWMEKKGIWHMSLKGINLKKLYPGELRFMLDNDILFDSSFQDEVCRWFQNREYEVIRIRRWNNDAYQKKPFYYFEMHTALYNEGLKKMFGSITGILRNVL